MKKTMLRSMLTTFVVLSLTPGCGAGASAGLFDLRMLLVPHPGQTRVQALCAEGNDAESRAKQLVEDLNASVEDDRALLEAVASAEGRPEGPITTYEVSVDGRTMVIEAVTDGASETFSGTIDDEEVLQGATTEEGKKGTLTYEGLEVAWHTDEDGTVRVARTDEAREAALVLKEERVAIVVDDITAAWSADSGVFLESEDVLCWDGEERCDVTCDPTRLESLTADLNTNLLEM
jgi:hypothetical protein